MPQPKLVEQVRTDLMGDYETRWMCEPPAEGEPYLVEEDEWTEADVRVIHTILVGDK